MYSKLFLSGFSRFRIFDNHHSAALHQRTIPIFSQQDSTFRKGDKAKPPAVEIILSQIRHLTFGVRWSTRRDKQQVSGIVSGW